MLNFRLKGSILLAALASISLQAQENDVENSQLVQTQSAVTELENPASGTANLSDKVISPINIPETHKPTCPEDFYTLPLYPAAKFCQLFSEQLPASMSYFAMSSQQTAKAFYLEKLGQAEDEKMLKGRIVLQYSNGQKVIVISKDGHGSQIDILIKSIENI